MHITYEFLLYLQKQFVMRIGIKATELEQYIWITKVLGLFKAPFNQLRQREIEVYAYLNMVYNRYASLGDKEANTLTFNKGTKKEICDQLGITIENFYNILVTLRKHGLVGEDELKIKLKPTTSINIDFK